MSEYAPFASKRIRALSALGCFIAAMVAVSSAQALGDVQVRDLFGRSLKGEQLRIVDWEGYIANPAIEVFVAPPADANLPAVAEISADHPRLYFDCQSIASVSCASSVGANGPETTLSFRSPDAQSFYVSIFPDRDGQADSAALKIELRDGGGTSMTRVPVVVTDQDRPDRGLDFEIALDFRRDEAGFDWFAVVPDRRTVAEQAARDWAYFIDDMDLDRVAAGDEKTFTWAHPRGFHSQDGDHTTNHTDYAGFRLYPYGIRCQARGQTCNPNTDLRSGGAPMAQIAAQVQHSDGEVLRAHLWRSGFLDLEIEGNYDTTGWIVATDESRWFDLDNRGDDDLYSILRHELGHALAFNDAYAGFPANGALASRAIQVYLGAGQSVRINADDHFAGAIDPASLHGAFGNEYNGRMPTRRWLVTKLDLLLLEAVGYRLRETSPLVDVNITTAALARGRPNAFYHADLNAKGGIPVYDWRAEGLPEGLTLDRFTGEILGTPREAGTFTVDVLVCDYQPRTPCDDRELSLTIQSLAACADHCAADRDRCLTDGELLPRVCVQVYRTCLKEICGSP